MPDAASANDTVSPEMLTLSNQQSSRPLRLTVAMVPAGCGGAAPDDTRMRYSDRKYDGRNEIGRGRDRMPVAIDSMGCVIVEPR